MARKEDFNALTNTQNKNRQEELRAKIRRIENGGNILKILGKALIATKMPQGATAIKENLDVEDDETRRLTEKSMDYMDRFAIPALIKKNQERASMKQSVARLQQQYGVGIAEAKAIAAGGFGSIQQFINQVDELNKVRIGLKDPLLTGPEINGIVQNADAYRDDTDSVTAFIDKKMGLTKNLLKEHGDNPRAAIFASLIGTPQQRSTGELDDLIVSDGMSAFDLIRYSKAGLFEDTSQLSPYVLDQVKMEEYGTANINTRMMSAFPSRLKEGMQYSSDSTQYANNTYFKALLLKEGFTGTLPLISTGEIDTDTLSSTLPPDEYEKFKRAFEIFSTETTAFTGMQTEGEKNKKAVEQTRTIISGYQPSSKEDLLEFIKIVDPLAPNGFNVFRDFDEWQFGDGTRATYKELKQELENM
jgi:hypothetical protein